MNGRRRSFLFLIVSLNVETFTSMVIFLLVDNRFFNQTKQEVLQKNGKPNSRDVLDETCEDINFDGIEYTFGAKYPYSARITDPNIRFGILKIGVGSPRWEVMLAYGFEFSHFQM